MRLYFRAEDGAQTRDPQLGRLMLYQLSYFRKILSESCEIFAWQKFRYLNIELSFVGSDGFEPPKSKDS